MSLCELGLELQLGHRGDQCANPAEKTRRVVVSHELNVHFCKCPTDKRGGEVAEWIQLFREGWYPATTGIPSTAFTFNFLNTFQELNLQGKTNLFDWWKTMERITDNSGMIVPVSTDYYSCDTMSPGPALSLC